MTEFLLCVLLAIPAVIGLVALDHWVQWRRVRRQFRRRP